MADQIYINAGKMYEMCGQYGVCTVLNDLATQEYYCVTKAQIVDIEIHWHFACVFDKKQQAVQFAKEVDTMYEQLKNRALVENIGYKLDDEIHKNREGYHYDFDTTLNTLKTEYSTFDVCAAVALTVDRASEWDGRYSNASKKWAKDFLFNNDIDAEDYKNVRLCNTHPTVINGFAEWLSNKTNNMSMGEMLQVNDNNEELDMTQEYNRGR